MKTLDLGKVAISPKGEYSASTQYYPLDLISFNGSSFLVLKDVIGVAPVEGEYYQMLAQRGEQGIQGLKGDTGAVGPAGADGIGKKRMARFVIGHATAGWTSDDCDYLCNGVNDTSCINSAIQALPENGGEIIILDGTYLLSSKILIDKDNVRIQGNGFGTKLYCAHDVQEDLTMKGYGIHITANQCMVSNLSFYANISPSSTTGVGANFIMIDGSFNVISQNYFGKGVGAYLGALATVADNNMIICNIDASGNGFSIRSSGNIVSGNLLINGGEFLISGSENLFVSNLLIDPGFAFEFSSDAENTDKHSLIIGNCIVRPYMGFYWFARNYQTYSAIIGNVIIDAERESFDLTGSYNYIANNVIYGGPDISNSGTSNTLQNNKYYA